MSEVDLSVKDGIATVVIDAPRRRNAITAEIAEALVRSCAEIDADQSVGAVILRSEGPVFCSGADRRLLAAIAADPTADEHYVELSGIYRAFLRFAELVPPTIALVQGAAVGAGLNLALAADLRVVTPEARMVSGFLPIGIHPGGGHFTMLAQLAGAQTGAAMGLFGEPVVGADCVTRGLAWSVVDPEVLVQEGRRLAAVPASRPALARRAATSHRAQATSPWPSRDLAVQAEQSVQMWSLANGPLSQGR